MKTNPIIYKSIPCQFAFFITENTESSVVLKIKQVTTLPSQKEFKTLKEAKQFIKNLKQIL